MEVIVLVALELLLRQLRTRAWWCFVDDLDRLVLGCLDGSVVGDATGLTLEEGEALVFRPLARSRFRLIGRILPAEWARVR